MSSSSSNRKDDKRMARMIAKQMAKVLPDLVNQLNTNKPNNDLETEGNNDGVKPTRCTFKHFNSCGPQKFHGTEGAIGLIQWFESIENTFINSECPEDLKVRHGTSVLQGRALTWWNNEKRTRGVEVALALPWTEVKDLMKKEFCPDNELKSLEDELWNLKQDSGENIAYNTRFSQLSDLVPHLVSPLSRAIDKYIRGLPSQIQDTVFGSKPTTLEEAQRLSAILTDNHVKKGTLTRKGIKSTTKASTESSGEDKEDKAEPSLKDNNKKRKANTKNYAVTTPTTPAIPVTQVAPTQPTKKPYTGTLPLCNSCKYHHAFTTQCRQCTNCGRLGHYFTTCRQPVQAQGNPPQVPPVVPLITYPNVQPHQFVRACYNCGDPNHLRNTCPRLVIVNHAQANQANPVNQVARGRVFNINANQAQANNGVVNGDATNT